MEVHIGVSPHQVIMGRHSFMPDVYPLTSSYHLVDPLENNLVNASIQIEIPNKLWMFLGHVASLTGPLNHVIRT